MDSEPDREDHLTRTARLLQQERKELHSSALLIADQACGSRGRHKRRVESSKTSSLLSAVATPEFSEACARLTWTFHLQEARRTGVSAAAFSIPYCSSRKLRLEGISPGSLERSKYASFYFLLLVMDVYLLTSLGSRISEFRTSMSSRSCAVKSL